MPQLIGGLIVVIVVCAILKIVIGFIWACIYSVFHITLALLDRLLVLGDGSFFSPVWWLFSATVIFSVLHFAEHQANTLNIKNLKSHILICLGVFATFLLII